VVLDLRPTLLDDYGLESALSWYASTHLTNAGTTAEFIPDGVETRLSPMVETVLFRIGQEAISNASKYAGAKNVRISLAVEKDANPPSVVLKVEDDGCGFDVKAAAGWNDGRPRFGLLGMQERVELVGGDLEIRSAPGFGTQVIARVPLSIATQENNNP
jgi:signal transduction histidine kinase